jgi:hypothetical protein
VRARFDGSCEERHSLFGWLVAAGWCWFVLREQYCWLVADGWFVMREKYCWLVADKSSEQGVSLGKKDRRAGDGAEGQKWEGENDGPWEGAGADARTAGEPHTSFFS